LEEYHCACSWKARGKATKLKKQINLQNHLRVHDLQDELTPVIYFACWFSWSKNYNLDSLKLVYEEYHYACSLKARGKATKLKKKTYLQKHLRVHDLQGE
jgi:hypothetical protein